MAATKTKTSRAKAKNTELNKVVDAPQIEASTMDDEPKLEERSGETIAIACCLPFGLKFTDIPSRTGGTKTIILPGVNSSLKGKGTGILALPGNAVCVTLLKEDWENILRIHGREDAFIGRKGGMPCIWPVGDLKGFKAAKSEIKEMKTGLEPIDPKSVGVVEADRKEI